MAINTQHPGVFWTHNDSGGEAAVYAVDRDGTVLGRVAVTGAVNQDWEDIATGPCPEGTCLYIADTGDNMAQRGRVVVYRIPEPAPDDEQSAEAVRLSFRYPAGPRDSEALFVLPDQSLYLVTKGRRVPVEVFRGPTTLPADSVGRLEWVQALTERPQALASRATGAGSSPDGKRVAIRTQDMLQFFDVEDGRLVPSSGSVVNLRALREVQGEAVALDDDGLVALTSEAGPLGRRGSITLLNCSGG